METLAFLFSIFFPLIFFTYTGLCAEICKPSSCGPTEPKIRFPFRLKDRQTQRCGYPGFDLSCNNRNQTVLTLPSSAEFVLTNIDYTSQTIRINLEFCLPSRIGSFTLSASPFRADGLKNYTFFNCSSWNVTEYPEAPIRCLSDDNYTVIALPSSSAQHPPRTCRNVSTDSVLGPAQPPVNDWHYAELQLKWSAPRCGNCEARRGTCGFKSANGSETGCSNLPSNGLPRTAKYGIIMGVGVPTLVCIIGLACCICSKIRACGQHGDPNTESSTATATPTPIVFMTGLDGPTIESYPKTVLGQSGRLPKPSDGTCTICLAEYQPKDTLRTIPECNHYFHASCIDEWLRLNATCPVCRNSPESSLVVTPCSSISSSSSSS